MSYTSHKTIPQRFTGLAVVAAFHVVVVYLLATGLGGKLVEHTQDILQTKVIEEEKKVEDEPPPPPPDMKEPPPFIPPPEVSIAADAAPAPTNAIREVTNTPTPVAAPVVRSTEVQPKPSKRNTIPPYPQASTRLGEQGVCVLQLLIDEEGKVADVRLAKTSGFPRLDEAALKFVKRAWRFTPGTKDGKPAKIWVTQNVRFVLK